MTLSIGLGGPGPLKQPLNVQISLIVVSTFLISAVHGLIGMGYEAPVGL